MKKIKQILVVAAFITLLPLIAMELMIKRSNNFVAEIKLNFQIMLFVIDLGD